MKGTNRLAIFIAMVLFTIVSIWTTYVSLRDSILPRPTFPIEFAPGRVHELSVFALALSVAIGLMLFALKLSIIDGQKRLNLFGLIGLTVVASISIAFNMDVLYRTADREFFLDYSESKVRSVYENYLASVQSDLNARKQELEKQVAKQEGELESEIKGLRERPAGYGTEAKHEEYELTLLGKTAEVELQGIEAALEKKLAVDAILLNTSVATLEDVARLQDALRVQVKDLAALTGTSMPAAVKLDSPFFAVFQKLFNFRTAGPLEYLILALAFLLDLADIIGYSLVPNRKEEKKPAAIWASVPENLMGPEVIRSPKPLAAVVDTPVMEELDEEPALADMNAEEFPSLSPRPQPRRKPFRFRRH
ncbi:MAG TPA: hypothetical protein PLJ47_13905 [Candidatus Hydrogenedentes bacterium]|nr:hypothetical protein [Candidatus Hydrogenedentota bacterium]